MSEPFEVALSTVVDRELRGENMLFLTLYSPSETLFQTMKKVSAKKAGTLPDIFDDICVRGEIQTPSSIKFAREFEIIKRRTDIAQSYDGFEQASKIARCVVKNGRHIEDSPKLSSRLRKALDAICAGSNGSIVRLKFMYLLARDEGYAVREDFYAHLPEAQRELFALIVKTPSAQLKEFATRADSLLEKLCAWISADTDISVDD